MNKKQKVTIILLLIFAIGMCIGAADAAHTVKKGKYKVKLTEKEYKKLTSYETKYKTVKKTRNVTKYHRTLCTVDKDNGYIDKMSDRDYDNLDEFYAQMKDMDCYSDVYFEKEPYTVTEKYTVKEPYKVRKDVTITKKVPKKYIYVKKSVPVVKTVKVKKTVGKYKYIGKYNMYDYTQTALNKQVKKNALKLVKKGYKLDGNDIIYKKDGTYIKGYIKAYKKTTVKQKRVVGEKYKKVKEPLIMTISSWGQNAAPKGKVYVWVAGYGYVKAKGYAKIK